MVIFLIVKEKGLNIFKYLYAYDKEEKRG
jgi:hypothetical protein